MTALRFVKTIGILLTHSTMLKRVQVFRELLAKTPVDELEVREHLSVIFRVNDNTWLEAIVRYVVPAARSRAHQNTPDQKTSRCS